jgi:hypothetical protein
MKPLKFSLTQYKSYYLMLINGVGHKTLAVWARDCTERVMCYYEDIFPQDRRPRESIVVLEKWIDTGVFRMSVIRGASLAAHSAAKDVDEDNSARSAAHAAGQAVATAHVPTHSIGAACYALQAVFRAANLDEAENVVVKEREWQHQHLLDLREKT